MAFQCDICGKGARVANNVSHSNRKSKRTQKPNIHKVHAVKNGHRIQLRVCTRCIRSGRVTKAA